MEKYRWSEEIFDDLRSNIIAALDLSREQNDEEVCRFIEKEVEEYSRKNLLFFMRKKENYFGRRHIFHLSRNWVM